MVLHIARLFIDCLIDIDERWLYYTYGKTTEHVVSITHILVDQGSDIESVTYSGLSHIFS